MGTAGGATARCVVCNSQYELAGGFIKNAVVAALLSALDRTRPRAAAAAAGKLSAAAPAAPSATAGGATAPCAAAPTANGAAPANGATPPVAAQDEVAAVGVIVTHEDLVAGCRQQMRGSLRVRSFEDRLVPTRGLDGLVMPPPIVAELGRLIRFERARGVVFGAWGFGSSAAAATAAGAQSTSTPGGSGGGGLPDPPRQFASVALFVGPPGAGKQTVASAVGWELGRPLKLVHCAQASLLCISPSVLLSRLPRASARLALDEQKRCFAWRPFSRNRDRSVTWSDRRCVFRAAVARRSARTTVER